MSKKKDMRTSQIDALVKVLINTKKDPTVEWNKMNPDDKMKKFPTGLNRSEFGYWSSSISKCIECGEWQDPNNMGPTFDTCDTCSGGDFSDEDIDFLFDDEDSYND